MRIECEVCNATYTIDDGQLSDQPIGAQCPYCGHVRLVRRGDASAPAPAAAQTVPSFGAQTDLSLGLTTGGSVNPFAGAPPPPAPPPASGGGFQENPFGGGANPFSAPPPAPQSPFAQDGAPQESDATCHVCGTALTDEFDKVIGLCDQHQRDRRTGDGAPSLAQASNDTWYVRTSDGRAAGPLGLEDVRTRVRSGEFSPNDSYSSNGVTFLPISEFKELSYLASLGVGGQAGLSSRTSYARPSAKGGAGRFIMPILILGVLGAVGFFGYTQRDQLKTVYDDLVGGPKKAAPAGPSPLSRHYAQWRINLGEVTGSVGQHLEEARRRHLEDTSEGYNAAELAYKRALLIDEQNAEAAGGFVENLAIHRYQRASLEELRTARATADYLARNTPNSPAGHRAKAALALARQDLDGCREGADAALKLDATDGRAKLLLAGCFLEGNVDLAINEAERARRLVPELRRVDSVLAGGYSRSGRFASAFDLLTQRLQVDPDNGRVHQLVGDIARDVGQRAKALSHYRMNLKKGDDPQAAHIAMGELFLTSRESSQAIASLRKAAQTGPLYGARAARAYQAWARGEFMRRRYQRAIELADEAVKAGADDYAASQYVGAALLVRGEAALAVGSATTAQAAARRARAKVGENEPSVAVLMGRVAMAQNQVDAGLKHLEAAVSADAKDPRLKGILAAAFLMRGDHTRAFTLMRKAADTDPLDAHSLRRRRAVSISDLPVREAIEQFRQSASEERNLAVASAAIGMLYYHLGDRSRSTSAIDRALRADDANLTALIYRAQLALDKNDPKSAIQSARKLLAVERGSALAHLMLARAYRRLDKQKDAVNQYEDALRNDPGLLSAKVELAHLNLDGARRESALEQLSSAFRVDPYSIRTRQVLLDAGL